ncbi:hypothetical protein CVT26_015011 [Gymnopilus dilepis]|uniref:Uncharacterized protein n=1 Tax=Gymnopilus dilepis TaxID=231916 RepID=A0A409X768_9AGAR|nr:hypothetical protein CVT26_015011 [Gymnopilus dilepis]
MDLDDEEEENESSDNSDSELLVPPHHRKIPKPQGEPGRPHSGGYTLSKMLKGWGHDFKIISGFIKDEADKMLDTTICYKNQPQALIDTICDLASARFPILDKYENHWPVRDILKTHIKYRCTKRGGKNKRI